MPNKKIVYFTRYSELAPSSRFRSYSFEESLKHKGYEVVLRPLFNDRYMRDLFSKEPKRNKLNAILCYLRRFIDLIVYARSKHFIIVEKEFLPYFPPIAERWMHFFGINYSVDIDDAVFAYYDNLSNPILKRLLGNKIDIVFKLSRYVLAGNEYLADRARKAGAKDIVMYPTIIAVADYVERIKNYKSDRNREEVVVGWMGSPSTVKYFNRIVEMLDELSLEKDFKLHIAGGNIEFDFKNIEPRYIKWSEDTEVETISDFDIGIMPLKDTDFERGKCGLKLIQYFGCYLPVVAAPVGVNASIVEPGINGYLAETSEEWKKYLSLLIDDADLRKKLGQAGFKKALEKYDLNANIRILTELIDKA